MRGFLQKFTTAVFLSGCVIAFVYFVEMRYLGGLLSPVGTWIVPPLVGALASFFLRGPVWVKSLYCVLIFPFAYIIVWTFLMETPRDADANAFLFFYVLGFTIYSLFGLAIAHLIGRIILSKHDDLNSPL